MRIFESLLILVNLVLLISGLVPALKRRRQWSLGWAAAVLALMAIHLWWEAFRWQMIPIYFLTAVLVLVRLRRVPEKPGSKLLSATGFGLGFLVLLAGFLALVLLPVPRTPALTGPYEVGTVTYHWVDPSREELYGPSASENRELMVQVWYPAEAVRGVRPDRWLQGGVLIPQAMTAWSHFPHHLLDQIALTRGKSYPDAPLAAAAERFPVVVYVHGWGGYRNINLDQLEALASHGYVVVSADHPYGALVTVFPDGRIVSSDPVALRGDGSEEGMDQAAERLVGVWAQDLAFMLDQMAGLDQDDPEGRLTDRLDLERIGVFGHSTGGGTVVRFCADDDRCKAAFGQDAWVEPVPDASIEASLSQPLLLVNSEEWGSGENQELQQRLLEGLSGPGYFLSIEGTSHYDFVMVAALSPIAPQLGAKGPLPGPRVMEINREYLVGFFDKYLMSQDVPLLDGPSAEYPEVIWVSERAARD